jgi:uncharacterized membrane protein YfhO
MKLLKKTYFFSEKKLKLQKLLTDRKTKIRLAYYLSYTGFFFLFFILTFHSFFIEKRSFVWQSDGLGQYIVNLYALYSRMYEGVKSFFNGDGNILPIYSFHVGLGADILGSYFVTLSEYLGALFKRENIEIVYGLITIFKMYVSGLTFTWLCRYFKRPYTSTLVGTLIYVFSGFTLYYGIRHPQFIMPMILLPCLIIALDRIIMGKSCIAFTLLIFYSIWLEYYFLYINTIILGIYFIVRYMVSFRKKSLKNFISSLVKIGFSYLLGIGLAIIPFISKLQDFLNSPRTKSGAINNTDLLWYGKNWIGNFISRLFAPYTQSDYLQHYMLFSMMAIVLPMLVVLFAIKGRYKALKIWMILSTMFFVFPVVGFIFSGFNATINRWSYGYVLLCSFVTATVLPNFKKLTIKHFALILAAVSLYISICFIYKEKSDNSVMVSSVLMFVTLVFIFLFILLLKYKKVKLAYSLLISLMLINVFINGDFLYSESKGKFASEFVEKDGVLARFTNSLDATASTNSDSTFYRTELFTNNQYTAGFPKVWQYNGTSVYASTNNKYVIGYGEDLENIGILTVGNIYNFDGRSFLAALGSVKYYVIQDGCEAYVPYGFKYKYTDENENTVNHVYENMNYLPLGYTFSSHASESDYNQLNAIEKQEAMLQTAFSDHYKDSEVKKKKIIYSSERKKYATNSKDVKIEKNKFIVENDEGVVDIKFNGDEGSEKYIEIEGLNVDKINGNSLAIEISTNDEEIKKGIWVPTSDDFYKLNENNYLINLGSKISGNVTVKIKFPYKGEYGYKQLTVYEQSTENLVKYIKELKAESLKNINVQNNLITGDISVSQEKILCFSIPYDKGWKLYVDGEPVTLDRINKMYMGALISKGNHQITLKYLPAEYTLGCIVTFFSCLILMVIVWRGLKSKREISNSKNEEKR